MEYLLFNLLFNKSIETDYKYIFVVDDIERTSMCNTDNKTNYNLIKI